MARQEKGNGLNLQRPEKLQIICTGLLLCFLATCLSTTNYWYVSVNDRPDTARLVVSVTKVKSLFDLKKIQNTDTAESDRAVSSFFKQLKLATGQIDVKKKHQKPKIYLTEIVPDFPVKPDIFRICPVSDTAGRELAGNLLYDSIILPIDPPPPKKVRDPLSDKITPVLS